MLLAWVKTLTPANWPCLSLMLVCSHAPWAAAPRYIDAAKAAGVKRFVPSEFGLDSSEPGIKEYFPALGYK